LLIWQIPEPVLLIGGGPVNQKLLTDVLKLTPNVVAADGGAHHMASRDHPIERIIGDLDSLTNLEVWRESGTKIVQIVEQDSTDFEKCVQRITERLVIGLGFLGGQLDHELAVLNTLVSHPEKLILLLGENDAVIHCPPEIALDLPEGMRLSLFPFAPVKGVSSTGLRWPIEGLAFSPNGQIGTSNKVTGPVRISVAGSGMVLMVPLEAWRSVLGALTAIAARD